MTRLILFFLGLCIALICFVTDVFGKAGVHASSPGNEILNVRDFGATGDGVTDDGPAFQSALDALAAAGGGTLFVPQGKYVIVTSVSKNFTGLAESITITGVESLTQPAPPTAPGSELSKGLDLPTEIYPRTGITRGAFTLAGLRHLVVKDIAFVGTPTVVTDAAITLFLLDIEKAQVKHSEFYALATLADGGAIIAAFRSDLEITQCKFLGSTATSGAYLPIVQNLEWLGLTVSDTTFIDYGQRAFFGKSGIAAPISWINIGNAAPPTNRSPRRQVVLKNVFLDEGSFWGLSSLPYRYIPASAPIDLIYVSGLYMNVSNFNQVGHQLYDAQRVFIEKSRYGWSHAAFAAVALRNVGAGILDQLTCVASADRLYADANTGELTVINSTYSQLDSQAQITNIINTATEAEDPVQYVRGRFASAVDREPDPAAHYYWSDLLIHCFDDLACQASIKQKLDDYLSSGPARDFALSGRITDDENRPLAGVTITLSRSQSVSTTSDDNGDYVFSNLPTSGDYLVAAAKAGYIFDSPNQVFLTPSGDRTANFRATPFRSLSGRITVGGAPLAGVTVAVAGSTSATATTDGAGEYFFALDLGGDYTLTPTKTHYSFNPGTISVNDLHVDTRFDFTATAAKHSLSGRVLDRNNIPIAGVAITLSGSVNGTTTTASDGSYSFANIDGGSSFTVTASHANYLLSPSIQTITDLTTDAVADFQAAALPMLLTEPGSDRALALELTTLVKEPFSLTTTLLSDGRNRTRIIFFGINLDLLPGEGTEALTAEAEDIAHVRYSLRVESVTALPEVPGVAQIILRLSGDLDEDAGDVLVSISVRGIASNQVRIGIGHLGNEP